MQAAVNGIRASGATSQLILVEGTSYTGAWSKLLWLDAFRETHGKTDIVRSMDYIFR